MKIKKYIFGAEKTRYYSSPVVTPGYAAQNYQKFE